MARSISSASASQDWLSRATTKLEKSIFRTVDYKYKNKLSSLYAIIKRLEDEANSTQNELFDKTARIVELEKMLAPYTNPMVTLKNLEKEVFRVLPTIEKIAIEEGKKRKFDEEKEINEIILLRDAPASKILKVEPAPRSVLPLPLPSTKPISTKIKKKRARSTSPTPKFSFTTLTEEEKRIFAKRNQVHSPQPQPQPTPLVNRRPAGNWKKRKKNKEEWEKEGNL